jgi:hypothetical protein
MRYLYLASLGLLLALGAPNTALAAPPHQKFFVVVHGVEDAPGVSSGVLSEAKQLFVAALRSHPEITLEPPFALPSPAAGPEALKAALRAHHLTAYEVTLRVLGVTRELNPPLPGKQFKVLTRGIRLAVFGDTLPEKVLAIGGEGDAQIGAEVGRTDDLPKQGKELLVEATQDAVKQAVDMTVTKLDLAGKAGHPKRHRRRR